MAGGNFTTWSKDPQKLHSYPPRTLGHGYISHLIFTFQKDNSKVLEKDLGQKAHKMGVPGWLRWLKVPTKAQVMISRGLWVPATWGSVLTAQRLEPTLDSVSPSLSVPPLLVRSLFLPLSLKNEYT